MIVYFEAATGRIVKTVRSVGAVGTVRTPPEGLDQLDAPDVAKPFEFYVKNETMLPYPVSPGDWAKFDLESEQWTDPRTEADHADAAADALALWRASASCSRMQGTLVLGEARWANVLEYRNATGTTWSEIVVIDDARDWFRNSETIQLFGWLLNLTPTEIDALFVSAATIAA